MKKTHILENDLKTLNGESLIGEGDISVEPLTVDASTLTEEQLDYIRDRQMSYGAWQTTNIGAMPFVLTSNVTRIPIFRNASKEGNLVNNDDYSITLKKGMLYRFEFFIACDYTAAGQYSYMVINSDTGDIINQIISDTISSTSHRGPLDLPHFYFNFDEDTRVEIRPVNSAGNIASFYSMRVQIVEISSIDVKLANFSINGKRFDENNNIDLEGRGTMSNPKLDEEILTEFRHPVSGKPIYTKSINFGNLPNAVAKNVTHGVVNAEDVWIDESRSLVKAPDGSIYSVQLPNPGSLTSLWTAWADRTYVSMATGSNRTTITAIITILYTKTTDTAESPVRLTGGFTLDDAIGALTINGKNFDAAGNVTLEGLSELSSPKLNVETLTEKRHPVSQKPIYLKTIDFGFLPNTAIKNVAHTITNCDYIGVNLEYSYIYIPGVYGFSFTGAHSIWNNKIEDVGSYIEGSSISLATGRNRTNMKAYITVEYTKTSDTAESPVRLVGGGFKYIESSTEPNNPSLGDEWHNTTNDILYKRRKKNDILGWYEI